MQSKLELTAAGDTDASVKIRKRENNHTALRIR
jgi:hypothetical protein